MMTVHRIMLLSAIAAGAISMSAENFDLVIVGSHPANHDRPTKPARDGQIISDSRAHRPHRRLPANGLGATDIATRGATTGLFSEFTEAIKQYYIDTYGENSQQVKDCSDGFHFEPSVAEKIFGDMIAAKERGSTYA